MDKSKVILIIEDEADIADLLSIFFEALGYSSRICSTFKEVEKAFGEVKPSLIFCDFLLPDAKGDYIYNTLKKADENIAKRFVLMTGTLIEGDIMDFANKEKITVLQKPFSIDTLQNLILRLEKT